MSASNDIKNEKKQNEIKDTEKKRHEWLARVGHTFWVAIVILILLLIFSIIVLSIRISNYSKADEREISLKSNMDAELDIFSVIYQNSSGEITVEGADGQKVIAPGTDVEYTVRVRNVDKVAIDYQLVPHAEFLSEHEIPIVIRLINNNEEYLVGDAKSWAEIEELNGVVDRHTLASGETAEYVFKWKWPFESGDDAYDTFLGNITEDEAVGVLVTFTIRAEANLDLDVNGGLWGTSLGRTILILIFAILLLIAIILLLISLLKRRAEKEPKPDPDPDPVPVIIPVPEPEPAPAPIVVPVFVPRPKPIPKPEPKPKKKEGFVGKMEYINLDVLQEHFESGERITLAILKEKGLIDPRTKQMKVLARNGFKLDKVFIIETQGISFAAAQTVQEAGGRIIITKG